MSSTQPDLLAERQRDATEDSDVESVYAQGTILFNDQRNVLANIPQAIQCFEIAANLGHMKAKYNLGLIYESGSSAAGIDADVEKAVGYFESTTIDNPKVYRESMYRLGLIYHKGKGRIKADVQKALECFEIAAQLGDVEAMYNAGIFHDHGHGDIIKPNATQALHYYQMAVEECLPDAMLNLGVIYSHGKEEIPMNVHKAIELYEIAAAVENPQAMFNLGTIYINGRLESGIDVDIPKALEYFTNAACRGHSQAMFNLGYIYESGYNNMVEIDMENSIEWYIKAIEKDKDIRAILNLGLIYFYGKYTIHRNGKLAFQYFKQGSDIVDTIYGSEKIFQLLNPNLSTPEEIEKRLIKNQDRIWIGNWCRYYLGLLYSKCKGEKEQLMAKKLFNKAIEGKFYLGYVGLASMSNSSGIDDGIHPSDEDAIQCLLNAAEQGVVEAWNGLRRYVDHSYLHRQWSEKPENLAALRSMIENNQRDSKQCFPFCRHVLLCRICQQEKSIHLMRGVNRDEEDIPSSHIDGVRLNLLQTSKLGEGGQGEVVLAAVDVDDPCGSTQAASTTCQYVALKKCTKSETSNDVILQQELLHLQIMRGSPFIVQYFGHAMVDRDLYVAMEAAPHGHLAKVLTCTHSPPSTALSLALMLRWMYEIASGIYYMHRIFIQHGDIKPLNVLLFDGLHVKLADFGWTRKARFAIDGDIQTWGVPVSRDMGLTNTTQSGGGTFVYMAPEVRHSFRPSVESDIFSFGMTCIHIINGCQPDIKYLRERDNAKGRLERQYGADNIVVVALLSLLDECISQSKSVRPTSKHCVQILQDLLSDLNVQEEEIGYLLTKIPSIDHR